MSVNRVTLIGNVGKDPDIKVFDNGGKVASFSLATTEKGYTSKSGKVYPEKVEWHNLVVFNAYAGVVEKYVRKGSQLYVEGKIQYRSYDDNNGIKRYVTEIYVDGIRLLGGRPDASSQQPQPQNQPQPTYQQPASTMPAQGEFVQQEDDLPF